MKTLIIALSIALVTGCVSSADYARLQQENAWLRQQRGGGGSGASGGNAMAPAATDDTSGMSVNDMVKTKKSYTATQWATALVSQPHGAYLCFMGNDPHLTVGKKFEVKNEVCDKEVADANVTGQCRDDEGREQYNTWVSMTNADEDVIVLTGAGGLWHPNFHPAGDGSTVLPPKRTCTFELGRSTGIQLDVAAYRNIGTKRTPNLDVDPDTTYHHDFAYGALRGKKEYLIDHSRF